MGARDIKINRIISHLTVLRPYIEGAYSREQGTK